MNETKLARFIYFFYKGYLKKALTQIEIQDTTQQSLPIELEDIKAFLQQHVDVYVQHADLHKEYESIYNKKIIYGTKTENPELFSELELFFIENFQLFCHSIAAAVLKKKWDSFSSLKLHFSMIDNVKINLLDLVEDAENS